MVLNWDYLDKQEYMAILPKTSRADNMKKDILSPIISLVGMP